MGIPRGPEDVTPAWLGSVLKTDVLDVDVTPIGTGQTGATYRVSATYAGRTTGSAELVRDQVVRTGRRGPRTRRARIPLGGRVLLADRRQDAHPHPPGIPLRHLRRRSRCRSAAGRHGTGGTGRSDRRVHTRQRLGWPWKLLRDCTARVGVTRHGWTCHRSPCRNRVTTPRHRDSARSRRWPPTSSSTGSAPTSALRIRKPLWPQCLR